MKALPRLVPSHEKDGVVSTAEFGLWPNDNAVGNHLERTADLWQRRLARLLGDGDPMVERLPKKPTPECSSCRVPPAAGRVAGDNRRTVGDREGKRGEQRRERLVHMQHVELFLLENRPRAEHGPRAQDDIGERSVGGDDHRAPHRDDVVGRRVMAARARMKKLRQPAGWIVTDEDAGVDAQRAKRACLMVGVVHNAAPEGPGERYDDANFHGASLSSPCHFFGDAA